MNITNGTLQPIREKFEDLKKNPDYLNQVVEKGASKARAIAIETIKQVREIVGFYVNK
jgi:tryptophanyl-tRNA synthetase